MQRWSAERAWAWYQGLPWLIGFNYLPRTAVNFVEMWQGESFDEAVIEEELRWARDIGFNCLRTNPPFIVWQHDPKGLIARIDRFLGIASAHGLHVMLCPLDDCAFSGEPARLGPQPAPKPGVHNSRAVASPGRELVMDQSTWPEIEAYVAGLITAFADDDRVLLWDLYNEPGNRMIFGADEGATFSEALEPESLELMRRLFEHARKVAPTQPLTVAGWHVPEPWDETSDDAYDHIIDQTAFALSDVISFHAYCGPKRLARIIDHLETFDRPLLITEWMARHIGSRIDTHLPIFQRNGVGCFQWGLVRGRTQTYLPWPSIEAKPGEWFHDLLREDGKAYCQDELALLQQRANSTSRLTTFQGS